MAIAPVTELELVTACADTTGEVLLSVERRDSIALTGLGTGHSNRSDRLASVSREYPGGFGGAYVHAGQTVLRFTDTTAARAELGAINERLASYFRSSFDTSNVRLVPSRWSFTTLYDWFRYLMPRVFGGHGVHMAGVDEARNRVTFITRSPELLAPLRAAVDSLGAPCGLVVLRVESIGQLVPGT